MDKREHFEWINPDHNPDPRHGQPSAEEIRKTNKPYVEKPKPSGKPKSEENKSGHDDDDLG